QPLGVQRPALSVTGDPAQQGAPAVQGGRLQGLSADLQMMAGNTFVVDGGGLQPGVELLRPGRDVPPHAAGPGEVLTGTGVVDPAGAGGGDAALQAAQRRRDVEVDISEL